jgi:hypothetical protein
MQHVLLARSYFFALAFSISLLGATAVQAEEIALSFDLDPPPSADKGEPNEPTPPATVQASVAGPEPLPVPAGAGNPPMRSHSPNQLPGGVYRKAVAVGLQAGNAPAALLPPAPPWYAPPAVVAQKATTHKPTESAPQEAQFKPQLVALDFSIGNAGEGQVADGKSETRSASKAETLPQLPVNPLDVIFEGGNDSLVARAVGSAEGTRTPTGGFNPAYNGHTDPGNGVWNMGTFSYQHGANTPAEADQKQLKRLQSQTQVLKRRATQHNLNLNLEETLNGIDLANQSPLASIGRVGYIERLVEARNMGYTGFESIVVARTRSYINPDTQRWNAPGLGNTLESITRDQRRRANAVAQAMEVYKQENAHINWEHWALMPSPDSTLVAQQTPPEDHASVEVDDVPLTFEPDGNQQTAKGKTAANDTKEAAAAPPPLVADTVAQPPPEQLRLTATDKISQFWSAVRPGPSSPETRPLEAAPEAGTEVTSRAESPKEAPSWMATLERNQTGTAASDLEQSPPSEPIEPLPEGDRKTIPAGFSKAEERALVDTPQPQGATPETTVMPPLREDDAPLPIPGFEGEGEAATITLDNLQSQDSTPLPEGLLGQLKKQVETVKEDPATGLSTMRDQLVEQIFEIDLSQPVDLE